MAATNAVDRALLSWGERLFYPGNRIVRAAPPARLDAAARHRASQIRQRIVGTVARRAPQVMVKVTGGGRGMIAIAAHFRYISKGGRLDIEDDRRVVREGKDAMRDVLDQWRFGGSFIDDVSPRREAFNIMLSMPRGTDPLIVQRAAREFARAELLGHRYVMVLHDHQANPHVHLSVRAESMVGDRLNPRKADLHRWRETFAEKLRGWGIDAEATRQATRGEPRYFEPLWRIKANEQGRLRSPSRTAKNSPAWQLSRADAMKAWGMIGLALKHSGEPDDLRLSDQIVRYVLESPAFREAIQDLQRDAEHRRLERQTPRPVAVVNRERPGPDLER
jgi:hypothetical protein